MIFRYSDSQRMLRDTLSRFLARSPGAGRKAAPAVSEGAGFPLWRALGEELGILGASFPEPLGGSGGGAVENMIVMEELGAALAGEPYLHSVVLCGGLVMAAGGAAAEQAIPALINGEAILALHCGEPFAGEDIARLLVTAERDASGYVLHGCARPVHDAHRATHLLVAARMAGQGDRVGLFLVDARSEGIERRGRLEQDGGAQAVAFESVRVAKSACLRDEGDALPLLERSLDAATAAICAEAAGVLRRLLADTIAHAKQRRQFGRPLASFQALRHRVADMYIELELCAGLALKATLMLERPSPERAVAVSQAKVAAARACRFVGQNAVQLHGGMGLTSELDVAHYFRRATFIESQFGSADFHLRRLEAIQG